MIQTCQCPCCKRRADSALPDIEKDLREIGLETDLAQAKAELAAARAELDKFKAFWVLQLDRYEEIKNSLGAGEVSDPSAHGQSRSPNEQEHDNIMRKINQLNLREAEAKNAWFEVKRVASLNESRRKKIVELEKENEALKAERDAYAQAMAIALREGIFANKQSVKEQIEQLLANHAEWKKERGE